MTWRDSVASAHGLWISFIQGRTFHDILAGEKYILAKRENSAIDFRREGEKKGRARREVGRAPEPRGRLKCEVT